MKLTQGKIAKVDDDDFAFLNKWKWHFCGGYAIRHFKRTTIGMHRLINKTPEGLETDHINRNKLDNQKSNLRSVTGFVNKQNSELRNKTGFKGIFWNKLSRKYEARMTFNGVAYYLGFYSSPEEASLAYRIAAILRKGGLAPDSIARFRVGV